MIKSVFKKSFFLLQILTISLPLILYVFFHFFQQLFSIWPIMIISSFVLLLKFYHNRLLLQKEQLQIDEFNSILTINKKLENANKELQKYNVIRDVMLQISHSIVTIKDVNELFQLTVDSAVEVLDKADSASILVKNNSGLFEFKASNGFDLSTLNNIHLSIDEIFANHSTNRYSSNIINNPSEFNRQHMSKKNYDLLQNTDTPNIKSTICTPILIGPELYGFITVDNIHHDETFNKEDTVIMEYLGGQLSIAIKNVLVFEKTLFLSRYDGLTKVYHRHYFDELYDNIFKRAKRYNEQFCLCIMDLNKLKQINDLHGHIAGDLSITHFANVLQDNIRDSDVLGRFGGDEFVLILLNTSPQDVKNKIEKISNKLKESNICFHDQNLDITFSFGIASFPQDSTEQHGLLQIADARMYANKKKQKMIR